MGVTSCEIKSGYGLDLENELKQLRVIKKLQETHPMDIDATFLGAHAVPEEYKDDPEGYVDLLVETILPAVAEEKLARCCDVFCETGVFDVPQSRKVLMAGKALGLVPRIHADEIDAIGGAQLSAEVGALSAEHLIASNEEGMQAMAKGGVIADLLPAPPSIWTRPLRRPGAWWSWASRWSSPRTSTPAPAPLSTCPLP